MIFAFKRVALRFAAALFIATGITLPLSAQNQPLSLFPSQAPEEEAVGTGVTAAPLAPSQDEPAAGFSGVEVDRLSELAVNDVGILGPTDGGFAPDVWQGSQKDLIVHLMARVEGALASSTWRDMVERLLLSTATAPNLVEPGANGTSSTRGASDFLALRVAALMEIGSPGRVLELLDHVPRSAQTEGVVRAKIEALLVNQAYVDACRVIRQEFLAFHANPFWARALIFCQIRDGEVDQALLGLDLLREGGDGDPFFAMLAFYLAGGAAGEEEIAGIDALHLAIVRLTGFPVSDAFVAEAPAYLWRALVFSTEMKLEDRLWLGERAAAAGLILPEDLTRLYSEVPFSLESSSAILSIEPENVGVRERALMVQAAHKETLDIARAEILARLLKSAQGAGRYRAVLGTVLGLLEQLAPRSDLAWFAPIAAQAFAVDNQFERAQSWLALRDRVQVSNPDQRAAGSFASIMQLNGLPNSADAPNLDSPNLSARARAAISALGDGGDSLWADIATGRAEHDLESVDASWVLALRGAASSKRLGETILMAAALMKGRDLRELGALEIDALISSLVAFEYGHEARLFATDLLLNAPLSAGAG